MPPFPPLSLVESPPAAAAPAAQPEVAAALAVAPTPAPASASASAPASASASVSAPASAKSSESFRAGKVRRCIEGSEAGQTRRSDFSQHVACNAGASCRGRTSQSRRSGVCIRCCRVRCAGARGSSSPCPRRRWTATSSFVIRSSSVTSPASCPSRAPPTSRSSAPTIRACSMSWVCRSA